MGNGNGNDGEVSGDYVDLGLSSGTKWKTINEKNDADVEYSFFTYDEAVAAFGNKLPRRVQCLELAKECSWTWTGMGYRVVGPNGKSISLPASGYRDGDGDIYVGSIGCYWSSAPDSSDGAWCLYFYSGGVSVSSDYRYDGNSVRLVKN